MTTNSTFTFEPAIFVPFRDKTVVAKVRALHGEALTRHANPDYRIQIIPEAQLEGIWIDDIVRRIRESGEAGEQLVMLMPNPWPNYVKVAERINRERINCHHIHTFNLDEYANEHGDIAPESWQFGFGHAFKKYFYAAIDADLRPPERQVHLLSNETLPHYGKMLEDLGGADITYVGPGWTGHLAFIDPDAPEFAADSLEEWKQMGTRICTLSPFTIAQNSLHGCFGASGDLTAVPPKAATVGPKEILAAKHRIAMHAITVGGSFQSWQRTVSRLVMHGPVTPLVPESILQTVPTDVWLGQNIAAPIETRWDLGY
jgi:6-phosphogluconolactonase/glucosamine-6-phosphate isomerase/deaminase